MINNCKIAIILFILPFITVYSQNTDSLLEKIKDLDISINEPVEEEENLYLNTVSFQSFYDILSPMGEWIQITKDDIDEDLSDGEGESIASYMQSDDDLLFIWKPNTESEKNWRPYMNGKWEYTNQGWLWLSNDKWGNSTYNYGRWWNSEKYGWVWLPGYTWAPAWVRWRVGNNGNHYGWVALSPKAKWKSDKGITDDNYRYKNNDNDWVFVNGNNFADELNSKVIIPENSNKNLIKESKKITDIRTEDDAIFTNGPDVGIIEQKTGKKFNRKRLRFRKGHEQALIGDNEIVIGKERFKKRNKESLKDMPKKFKKSERVKKMLKKRHRRQNGR